MTEQVTIELMKEFLEAFNRHDLDSIMDYVAEDSLSKCAGRLTGIRSGKNYSQRFFLKNSWVTGQPIKSSGSIGFEHLLYCKNDH